MTTEDSQTTDLSHNAEGGDRLVTGGVTGRKSKFKGATGGGHTVCTWGDAVFGCKITMTSEGKITLPCVCGATIRPT